MNEKPRSTFDALITHEGFRKYFANTSWLFGEQVLRMIAALLVGIYVARFLGPEKFGLFNYVLAFVALFSAVAKLGLDGIVVRELINEPIRRDQYLATSFWLKVVGAIGSTVVIFAAALVIENDAKTVLYIGVISIGLVFQSFEVVDFYFQSRVLSKYVSICKILQLMLSSLLKLYLVAVGADLFWFVVIVLIDQVSLAGALVYAYSRQGNGVFYFEFDRTIAKQLLIDAKPLITSGIMVSVYSSIDRVIIKELLGVREVGLYVAATTLTAALYFIPMLLANSLYPAILNAKQKSDCAYNRRLSLMYKCIVLFGILASLFVSVFSTSIVSFLYGSEFVTSASALRIYVWNLVPICFSAVFGKWLLSENLQYLIPRFTLVAIAVNISGCFILIPLFSINGAALAALLAQLVPVMWFGVTNKHMNSQLRCIFASHKSGPEL